MNLLLDHLPLLLVLTPLCGAVTLSFLLAWGAKGGQWSSLFSIGLSLLLAGGMIGNYSPDLRTPTGRPITTQMTTSVDWLGHPVSEAPPGTRFADDDGEIDDAETIRLRGGSTSTMTERANRRGGPYVRFAFGTDGVTLWLMGLVPLLTLGGWGLLRRQDSIGSAWDDVLLLLVQGAATAVFATRDAAVLALSVGLLTWGLALLGGLVDRLPEHRIAAKRMLMGQGLSDVLLLLSICGLAGTRMRMETIGREAFAISSFDLDVLTFGTAFLSHHDPHRLVWQPMEGWLFTGFVLALVMKVPLFPFHRRLAVHLPNLRPVAKGLAGVLPLMVGCYLAIRILIPLFPVLLAMHGVWLAGLLLIGLGGASLSMSREPNSQRSLAFLIVAAGSVIGIGTVTLSATGLLGVILLLIASAASLFVMFQLVAENDSPPPPRSISRLLPIGLAIALLPGLWVLWLGISRNVSQLPGRLMFGLFLVAIPLLIVSLSILRWTTHLTRPEMRPSPSRGQFAQCMGGVGILILVAIGFASPRILDRAEPTVARYVRQELPVEQVPNSPVPVAPTMPEGEQP